MDFGALAAVGRSDLLRLAELLEAELLELPMGALSLRDCIPGAHAEEVARFIGSLSDRGESAAGIALLLRAFADGRAAGGDGIRPVEVVASGPDAAGGVRDTGVVLRQVFAGARRRVLAVGFAVHQGRSVFAPLADRLDADAEFSATLCLDVRRPYGSTTVDRDLLRRFAETFVDREWPGRRLPCIYHDPRSLAPAGAEASSLHAKCVVADGREAFVTSANFTEAAQQRNIEIGLLLASPTVAGRIEEHFHALIRRGHLQRLPLPDRAASGGDGPWS